MKLAYLEAGTGGCSLAHKPHNPRKFHIDCEGAALSGSQFESLRLCRRMVSAPSMGAILEVKVLSRADHSERSEAQLHEGD